MKLIGILGFAGSGKDTVFRIMQKIDPCCVRYAFADALKEEVADAGGWTPQFINDNKPQFRELLQAWGVTRRNFAPDYWVEKTAAEIEEDKPEVAVLTDVRFLNEVHWVRGAGGVLIRVHRQGNEAVNGHVSEHELADFPVDYNIHNNGDLEHLQDEVLKFWNIRMDK